MLARTASETFRGECYGLSEVEGRPYAGVGLSQKMLEATRVAAAQAPGECAGVRIKLLITTRITTTTKRDLASLVLSPGVCFWSLSYSFLLFIVFFFLIITIVFHYVPVRACCKGIGDWKRHTSSGNDHLGGTVISVALRKLVSPLSSFIVLLVCFSDFTIFTPEEYDNMQNKSVPRLTQPAASSFPERTLSLPGIL